MISLGMPSNSARFTMLTDLGRPEATVGHSGERVRTVAASLAAKGKHVSVGHATYLCRVSPHHQ